MGGGKNVIVKMTPYQGLLLVSSLRFWGLGPTGAALDRAGKGNILGRLVLALPNSVILKKGGGNDRSKALP